MWNEISVAIINQLTSTYFIYFFFLLLFFLLILFPPVAVFWTDLLIVDLKLCCGSVNDAARPPTQRILQRPGENNCGVHQLIMNAGEKWQRRTACAPISNSESPERERTEQRRPSEPGESQAGRVQLINESFQVTFLRVSFLSVCLSFFLSLFLSLFHHLCLVVD